MTSPSGSRPILIDNSINGQSGYVQSGINPSQNCSYRPNTLLPFPFKTNEMNHSRQMSHQMSHRSQSPLISHSPTQNFGKSNFDFSNARNPPTQKQFHYSNTNQPQLALNRPQAVSKTSNNPTTPPYQIRSQESNSQPITERIQKGTPPTKPTTNPTTNSPIFNNSAAATETFPESRQSTSFENENKNIFNQDIKSDEGNLDSIFDDITAPPSNSTTEIFQFKEEYPSYQTKDKIDQNEKKIVTRTRESREPDASIKMLKCTQGGSYRFSMSKMSFSRTLCPFCYHKEGDKDIEKVLIRAEYWRRHVTEVHKSHDDVILTKGMTLCLPCYQKAMEYSKTTKASGGTLPDFTALFAFSSQKTDHIARVHRNNPNEATFVSVWDKKEKDPTQITKTSKKEKRKESISIKEEVPDDNITQPVTLNNPDVKSEPVVEDLNEEQFNLPDCPFNDQTFNFNIGTHEALNLDTDCSFNEFLPRDGNFGQSNLESLDQLINPQLMMINQIKIEQNDEINVPHVPPPISTPPRQIKQETTKPDPIATKEKLKAKKGTKTVLIHNIVKYYFRTTCGAMGH